jgi:hypothetical protein
MARLLYLFPVVIWSTIRAHVTPQTFQLMAIGLYLFSSRNLMNNRNSWNPPNIQTNGQTTAPFFPVVIWSRNLPKQSELMEPPNTPTDGQMTVHFFSGSNLYFDQGTPWNNLSSWNPPNILTNGQTKTFQPMAKWLYLFSGRKLINNPNLFFPAVNWSMRVRSSHKFCPHWPDNLVLILISPDWPGNS